jgi:hypothetical protein
MYGIERAERSSSVSLAIQGPYIKLCGIIALVVSPVVPTTLSFADGFEYSYQLHFVF